MSKNEKISFTSKQLEAISHVAGNALVSASAGSGKTRVVIERILNLILNHNVSLSEIIAVTFTKAAAEEMKDKLKASITKKYIETGDERLKEQLALIQNADVSTIHSFCSKLLRRYFYLTELDCKFDVIDEIRAEVLMNSAMDSIFDELYAQENADFQELVMVFGSKRKDLDLRNIISGLYKFCQEEGGVQVVLEKTLKNHENPMENLVKMVNDTVYYGLLDVIDRLSALKVLFIDDEKRAKVCDDLIAILKESVSEADENGKAVNLTKTLILTSNVKTGGKKVNENACKMLNDVRADLKKMLTNAIDDCSFEGCEEGVLASKNLSIKLLKLTELFTNRYNELKREENVVDFSDLERFTLKLLENEQVSNDVRFTYKFVFIDEYQDVNNVQEAILTAVGNDNIFMVGDSKQCIYAFRGCNPKFFTEKNARYKNGEGKAISLDDNFRSAEAIISVVNNIFKGVMTEGFGGSDYARSPMVYGNLYNGNYGGAELHVVTKPKKEKVEFAEERNVYSVKNSNERNVVLGRHPEAELILKLVNKSLGATYYDITTNTFKTVGPGDICILLRSMSGKLATDVINGLAECGIYASSSVKTGIMDYPEIKVLNNVLAVLVNVERDVPLASVMKTTFKFSDNELAEIRHRAKDSQIPFYNCVRLAKEGDDELAKKVEDFIAWIDEKRLIAEFSGVGEVLYNIIKETGYYADVMASMGGAQKIKRIERYLAESVSGSKVFRAQEFETHISESLADVTVSEAVGDNCVKVMTMHASKGLEFPVVIVAGAGSDFIMKDKSETVVRTKEYGIAVKNYNVDDMTVAENKAREVILKSIERNVVVEELRLFYVALTRAKYQLYVTATANEYSGVIPNDKYSISNFLSFIPSGAITTYYHDGAAISSIENENSDQNVAGGDTDQELIELIKSGLSYVYPYESAVSLPVKRSVSEVRNQFDDEIYKTTALFGESSAEKGTAYHRILELADFYNFNGLSDKLKFLENGYVTKEQFDAVDENKVKSILSLSIFNKIKDYTLYKERKFCVLIPANEIGVSSSTEEVLVQGVIDLLAVKDNKAILVDYKLSTIESDDDLKRKYAMQMQLYKNAIEKVLKLEVESVVIINVLKESEIYV